MRVFVVVQVRVEVAPCDDGAEINRDGDLAFVVHLQRGVEREHEVRHLVVGRHGESRIVLKNRGQFTASAGKARPDTYLIDGVSGSYAFARQLELHPDSAFDLLHVYDAHRLLLADEVGLPHEKARAYGSLSGRCFVEVEGSALRPLCQQLFALVGYYCVIPHILWPP